MVAPLLERELTNYRELSLRYEQRRCELRDLHRPDVLGGEEGGRAKLQTVTSPLAGVDGYIDREALVNDVQSAGSITGRPTESHLLFSAVSSSQYCHFFTFQLDLVALCQNDSDHLLSLLASRQRRSEEQPYLSFNQWEPSHLLNWWRLLDVGFLVFFLVFISIQHFDLMTVLQPFNNSCRLDYNTLTTNLNAVADNVVYTLKRWFDHGKVDDVRYLFKHLLSRAATQLCVRDGEDVHAAALLADSEKIAATFERCCRMATQFQDIDYEITKLASALSESSPAEYPVWSEFPRLVGDLAETIGAPRSAPDFEKYLGGELKLRCAFVSGLEPPSLDRLVQARFQGRQNDDDHVQRTIIDREALLSSLTAQAGKSIFFSCILCL